MITCSNATSQDGSTCDFKEAGPQLIRECHSSQKCCSAAALLGCVQSCPGATSTTHTGGTLNWPLRDVTSWGTSRAQTLTSHASTVSHAVCVNPAADSQALHACVEASVDSLLVGSIRYRRCARSREVVSHKPCPRTIL